MALKEIHSFDIIKTIKKEVTEDTAEGKLTKEVEVEEPIRVIIKKPTRAEAEEADYVYAEEYAKCVRRGFLTNALIDKLYANEEGFLSKGEQERYATQYVKFLGLQQEYQRLSMKQKKNKKEEEKIKSITEEWLEIEQDLQELQAARTSLFSNTAETKARDKTITWLALFLTYIQEGDKDPVPFYEGNDEKQKLSSYDEIIEGEDTASLQIIDKSSLYVSLWYMGKLSDPEDFKNFEQLVINREGSPDVEKKEETPESE